MDSSSSHSSTARAGSAVYIHRFAVRIDPPTLVVEYGFRGSGSGGARRGGEEGEEPRMLKYIKIRSSPQKVMILI
jgi:hypothetical protein